MTNLLKPSKQRKDKRFQASQRFILHFMENIIKFRCAHSVLGRIGEHNMKPNVKDPAGRTRYQDDQEYNILFKHFERHSLHAGGIELYKCT